MPPHEVSVNGGGGGCFQGPYLNFGSLNLNFELGKKYKLSVKCHQFFYPHGFAYHSPGIKADSTGGNISVLNPFLLKKKIISSFLYIYLDLKQYGEDRELVSMLTSSPS